MRTASWPPSRLVPAVCLLGMAGNLPAQEGEAPVDYLRQVLPILAEHCYPCHGPDEPTRKAGLRLDEPDGAFADRKERGAAIRPGDPAASLLIQRITHANPERRMPPPEAKDPLAPAQVELLRRWIAEGASWPEHWAFTPPVRPAPPEPKDDSWARNAIDRFILERLQREGLKPSPEAAKALLLRRATIDLTGLPPSPAELDAFLADAAPDAYDKAIDRLLASPRHGERQAQEWMDLARYADTSGYAADQPRTMWRWRDWVIDAFNQNMPFDRFTVEQLAGDLLPDATLAQKVASGFNRNHPVNSLGGEEEDEFRIEYVVDRVSTTATVWMGLTMGCARCHDHKYDPLTMRDFWRFSAYFNNVPERDTDGFGRNPKPSIRVPDPGEQTEKLAAFERDVKAAEQFFREPHAEMDHDQALWEQEVLAAAPRVHWRALEPIGVMSQQGAVLEQLDDGSILSTGPTPVKDTYDLLIRPGRSRITAFRLEVLPDPVHQGMVGRSAKGTFALNEFHVTQSSVGDSGGGERVRFLLGDADWNQTGEREAGPFAFRSTADMAVDGDDGSAWSIRDDRDSPADDGDRLRAHAAIFIPEQPLVFNEGSVLRIALEQTSEGLFKSLIGRFRITITDDEAIRERMVPVVPKAWHVIGPFAARSEQEAFDTAYAPEPEIAKGVDLKRKHEPIQLPKPEKRQKPKEQDKAPGTPAAAPPAENGEAPAAAPAAAAAPVAAAPAAAAPAQDAAEKNEAGEGDAADGDEKKDKKKEEKLTWKEQADWRDRRNHRLQGSTGAYFLHRELTADRARDVEIRYRGPDAVRVWLNGELVHTGDEKLVAARKKKEEEAAKKAKEQAAQGEMPAAVDLMALGVDPAAVPDDFDPEEGFEAFARSREVSRFQVRLRRGVNHLVVKAVGGKRGLSWYFDLQAFGRDRVNHEVLAALRRQAAEPAPIAAAAEADPTGKDLPPKGPMASTRAADADAPAPAAKPSVPAVESPDERRSRVIRDWFRRNVSEVGAPRQRELTRLIEDKTAFERELPEAMVMAERDQPRPTYLLLKGQYNRRGEVVEAGVPAVLPPLPHDQPNSRLTLARWLVSGTHPLTARVTVNRIWAQYFGQGLVASLDDFGVRGELPTHPELLDWLACELVESGWDLKRIHRLIATSATYRQASAATPELLERDDRNVLLARGPRKRMDAEMVRDMALSASGLLVEKIGGPSIKPYQPKDLWKQVTGGRDYKPDQGESLYRRGLYVYWKRGMPYPSMTAFDAPLRESCVTQRVESNTPLQALVLLNDPVYVEAARALGTRLLREGGSSTASRLAYGFRLCTSRFPSDLELQALLRSHARLEACFAEDEEAAKQLTAVGDSKPPADLDARQLATWTAVGNLLLNLDEAIHRG